MTRPPDDMPFVYRPIDDWPGEQTVKRRRGNFSGNWAYTLWLIKRELAHLDAHTVVCQVALEAKDFRLTDGHPKAQARASHPGVILAFESKHGPLKYATDAFQTFTENFHAIALSLQRLRLVDECGVTRRGEQYRGWSQLGSGIATNESMSRDEAARVLADLADRNGVLDGSDILAGRVSVDEAYKLAVKVAHPDVGGTHEMMVAATAARDVLAA